MDHVHASQYKGTTCYYSRLHWQFRHYLSVPFTKIFSSVEGKNENLMKLKKHNWLKNSHRLMPLPVSRDVRKWTYINWYNVHIYCESLSYGQISPSNQNLETDDSSLSFYYFMHVIQRNLRIVDGKRNELTSKVHQKYIHGLIQWKMGLYS